MLGANVSDEATEERKVGKSITIVPMRHDTHLKRAHARTFNLKGRLEAIQPIPPQDEDVEEVLTTPLFEETDRSATTGGTDNTAVNGLPP